MTKDLDTVVLTEDIPERGLKRGDLGTVVLIIHKPPTLSTSGAFDFMVA